MTGPSVCPACGAAVRADAPWCTLCYADLRPAPPAPAPPVEAPAEPVAPVAPAAPDVLAAGVPVVPPAPAGEAPAGPSWPCTACGTLNPMDRDTCASCGAGFLAAARDDVPRLEVPVLGDIGRFGKWQRYALAAGVILAFILLTALIGLILG